MANEPPDARVQQLEGEVSAIRDHLGDLIGELDRRVHRTARPLALAALAAAVLGLAGYVLWRTLR